jgi:energy-coupling factor transporter ATP-binding protein EcfA2
MIRQIEALNYRSLRYVSQALGPFQILVGPNASGKSTFLDVVALLSDFVQNGLNDALLFSLENGRGRASRLDELIFNHCCDHFELAIELAVPDFLRSSHQNGESQPDIARYEVAFGFDQRGELEIRTETLWLIDSQRSQHHPRPMTEENLPDFFPTEAQPPSTLLTDSQTPLGWQAVVKKQPAGKDYFQAETGSWNMTFRVGQHKAALAGVPEDPDRFPITIWVRDLLRGGIRLLALNSAAMRRPVSPSVSRRFSVAGANLPLVIQELKRHHSQSYQDWLAHLRTILPDLAQIEIYERSEDRHLYLALRYTSAPEPVPSWLISDGTLRLLALTLIAYLPDSSSLYLIEEPENGIHPKAVEGVFQSLSSVYRGQVLIATHSPLFLGLAEPQQLLCFAKNPSGAVDIISGARHPALKHWRGEIEISTLYAAGVLG